jgi:hypothetical protein
MVRHCAPTPQAFSSERWHIGAMRRQRWWWPCALGSALSLVQCATSSECTEVDCNDEAVVTYPAGLVSGAYDLILASEGAMLGARCLDPTAPETMDNPSGVSCDAMGFELTGDEALANRRTVQVTIIDVMSGETLAEGVEVILNAVDEDQPNGPGCPPTCYIRNGRLLI